MEIKSFCARADGKGGSVVVETDDVKGASRPAEFRRGQQLRDHLRLGAYAQRFLGVGRRIPALLLQRRGGLGERREHHGTLMEVAGDDVVA